ncbi:hypothetical protein TWF481_007000 [Arthrobotrys musiformis]|uniref:F-box domain-containing protein n=1 Tax=Arthrobotrys musiformis TaxID=47236 RepID=A0AAV9WA90_9PEZI
MASLNTLVPELLDSILIHLRKSDILSLLRTCKYIHSVCLPHIWSTLIVSDLPGYHGLDNSPTEVTCFRKLSRATDEHGVDALGFRFIKKLVIKNAGSSTFSTEAVTVKNGFQRLLGGLIRSGGVELRRVQVDGHKDTVGELFANYDLDLMQQIKKYSQSKSPSEFSMHIETSALPALIRDDFLNPLVLTRLKMGLKLEGKTFSRVWMDAKKIRESAIDPIYTVTDEIVALTRLLTRAKNLEALSIGLDSNRYEPGPIAKLSQHLRALHVAFNGLKRLGRLVIGTNRYSDDSCVFFHPSFFLEPPRSCRSLQYCSTVSAGWWRKFAAHPLTGVENLNLSLAAMSVLSRLWITEKKDEEAEISRSLVPTRSEMRMDFQLGNVAVTGLKKFTVGKQYYPNGHTNPIDLETCIYRKNRGLDWVNKRKMRSEVISRFHGQILDSCSIGLARCAQQVAFQHFEDYIGRTPIQDATAEKCLEEVRYGEEKYMRVFASLFSEWVEKNIDKSRLQPEQAHDNLSKKSVGRFIESDFEINGIFEINDIFED